MAKHKATKTTKSKRLLLPQEVYVWWEMAEGVFEPYLEASTTVDGVKDGVEVGTYLLGGARVKKVRHELE